MKKSILDFVKKLSDNEEIIISYDTELISSGIIDSLGIITMIAFIEEKFEISVEDKDFEIDNFASIDNIVAFIKSKQEEL